MKIKGILMKKVHILNIVISIALTIFAIVGIVIAYINPKSMLLIVFGVINVIWLLAQVFITFICEPKIKDRLILLSLFVLVLGLNLNIFFIYYGMFEKYVIYSSIIAILILIMCSSRNAIDNTEIEINNMTSFLLGVAIFMSILPYICVIINSIGLLRQSKNKLNKRINLSNHNTKK